MLTVEFGGSLGNRWDGQVERERKGQRLSKLPNGHPVCRPTPCPSGLTEGRPQTSLSGVFGYRGAMSKPLVSRPGGTLTQTPRILEPWHLWAPASLSGHLGSCPSACSEWETLGEGILPLYIWANILWQMRKEGETVPLRKHSWVSWIKSDTGLSLHMHSAGQNCGLPWGSYTSLVPQYSCL